MRWRSILLVVSLALNLFFGGMFVARHAFGPPRGPDAMLSRLAEELGAGLSDADRATLQGVLKSHGATIKERAADAMHARAGIRAAMTAEPFDAHLLAAAVDDASARDTAMRKALEQMLLDAATQISQKGAASSRPGGRCGTSPAFRDDIVGRHFLPARPSLCQFLPGRRTGHACARRRIDTVAGWHARCTALARIIEPLSIGSTHVAPRSGVRIARPGVYRPARRCRGGSRCRGGERRGADGAHRRR
jgi:uncharacterized membrane protein